MISKKNIFRRWNNLNKKQSRKEKSALITFKLYAHSFSCAKATSDKAANFSEWNFCTCCRFCSFAKWIPRSTMRAQKTLSLEKSQNIPNVNTWNNWRRKGRERKLQNFAWRQTKQQKKLLSAARNARRLSLAKHLGSDRKNQQQKSASSLVETKPQLGSFHILLPLPWLKIIVLASNAAVPW